jgi:succinate dehydrogenase hydrophobic anchor subunit
MGMFKKKLLLLLCSAAMAASVHAQTGNQAEMADTMRSNGKIYIVVAVCLTILIGLFIYVYSVDKKISKLEKQ